MKAISAIVLAAGCSRRMGAPNKLLLPFKETSILGRYLDMLHACTLDNILLVSGYQAEKVSAVAGNVPVVHNPNWSQGMTGSIQTGVRALPEAHHMMVCLADQPFLQPAHIQVLLHVWRNAPDDAIVHPQVGSRKGHPVIFAPAYRTDILALEEGNGCRPVLQAHRDRVVVMHTEEEAFLQDIDTPDDYRQVHTMNQ